MGLTTPVSDWCHPEDVDGCLEVPGEVGLVVRLPGFVVWGAENGSRATQSPARVEHRARVYFDPCLNRCPHWSDM